MFVPAYRIKGADRTSRAFGRCDSGGNCRQRHDLCQLRWQVVLCHGPRPALDVLCGQQTTIFQVSRFIKINDMRRAVFVNKNVARMQIPVPNTMVNQGLYLCG